MARFYYIPTRPEKDMRIHPPYFIWSMSPTESITECEYLVLEEDRAYVTRKDTEEIIYVDRTTANYQIALRELELIRVDFPQEFLFEGAL